MKRELGLIEVFSISSGAMISSGLFILPAVAYGHVGPSVIIAYLLASIIALPTILAKAELASAMPKTGGIFFFTDRSMGPLMGVLGGGTAWFSLALKSAFALYGLGIFAILLEPSIGMMDVKLIAIGFCVLFMVLNIGGAKMSSRFQVGMVMTLVGILVLYILSGIFFLTPSNFSPFFKSEGITPILKTTGLVFVSFAGSTKVAAVAGEVKKPGRNLPLGMFLSWGVVSLLYIATIAVTVGLLDKGALSGSETPISDGGKVILGTGGLVVMSLAGILAFVSTGNAGIMAASRDPMAMAESELLPPALKKCSRWGTPYVAIILTTLFMIVVIALTDVKQLASYASTLKLLLFILACLSMIFMRESNLKHYRPKYKAPFYPWAQILGMSCYSLIIIMLGWEKMLVASGFLIASVAWYFLFAYGRIKREYALLHVAEKVMGEDQTEYLLDEELREILIKRDRIKSRRMADVVDSSIVIDMNYLPPPEELGRKLALTFSERQKLKEKELLYEFTKEDRKAHMMMMDNAVILSYQVKGRDIYDMALIRTKRGAIFSEDSHPVHAAVFILFSKDERNFYLNSLMWLMSSCQKEGFLEDWKSAKDHKDIRKALSSRVVDIKGTEKGY